MHTRKGAIYMRVVRRMMKFVLLIGVSIILTFTSLSNIWAQGGGDLLAQIAANTAGILTNVNNLPNYMQSLGNYIISWMTNDTSSTTQQMQGSFANIGGAIVQDSTTQTALQAQLTATQFSPPPPASPLTPANLSAPANSPNSILNSLPNINDLAFATMLGKPPSPKAPNVAKSPYNYIVNASGITLPHAMPGMNWQGTLTNQIKYRNYYNTLMSIESFNAYVLSSQYAEAQSGNALTTAQNTLVSQASSSTWIAQIATEELGKVLRQILMFESQSYVLLTQLVQTQKQMLAAQVMTNSILIASLQNTESLLVSNAQGIPPQG
jgi:hypothetical protein